MLIEVIKDEEHQVESSFIGLKDVVLYRCRLLANHKRT
jgi:hypothetical protein